MMMNISAELVEQFGRGNGVIFVGAGLSQGAGLPGWADLVRELASELDGCPTDIDYREIAQYYDNEYGRQRLVQRLRDRLDTLNVAPTSVHAELAKLPVPIIFTTNYDDLLEQALRAAKRPFTPVVGNADVSFWSADRLQLVKPHGDLNQPESIIITTEDYDRFASSRKSLADILKVILQTRTVLFLGYSAADPDLRLILTQARDESGRLARNLYTVQFSPPSLTIKDLERRGLKVIDLAAQPDLATRNAAILAWLQALGEKIAGETLKLKPAAPPQAQTAVQVLATEIQIWLKAMGYTVMSRPGDDRMIDLEATLQRGLEEQHVLVRCIAGEITVRHLETLRQDLEIRNISKGWTVSDRRMPPSTRAFAEAHLSVRPFSLADFVSQIFGPYFDNLRRLVEESDIPKYYVDLACYRRVLDSEGREIGRDHYEVIDQYVDDWLKARDANHLSILGEFGSGKTWFCHHYSYRQLERYLADPVHERLPILITLRDYVKQVEVGSLIRKLLDEQGVQLGGGLEAFEELNRRGKLLLIFDGFDEMAVKVDYQTVVDYFWELAKVVVPGSKALLTCRTGYFRYATEAEKVMRGEELGRKMIVIQPPQFEVIYLEPFTDDQIREVIIHRHEIEMAETILNNPDLKELARQPVLIEMLMEALPGIQPDSPINKSEIYRLAVDRWLERDIKNARTFMNKQDKLFFMMELAWEMFSSGNLKIHYKELPERINRHFGLEQLDEKDHYDYDIRTKSFLQRDSAGYYEFTHNSFMEYFVARRLADVVSDPDFEVANAIEVWKPKLLTSEVQDFLIDMATDPASLWHLIDATRGKTLVEVGCAGGNAATVLARQKISFTGQDLEQTVLAGADLTGTDLRNVKLRGAILADASLDGAKLNGIDVTNAYFGPGAMQDHRKFIVQWFKEILVHQPERFKLAEIMPFIREIRPWESEESIERWLNTLMYQVQMFPQEFVEKTQFIERLVNSSLIFYRGSPRAVVDVNQVVSKVLQIMSQYTIKQGGRIQIEQTLVPMSLPCIGDSHQLEQLFTNIFINARDAIESDEGTGVINVSTNYDISTFTITVTCTDDGPGIQPKLLNKIFELFFTTKKDGGTGLGLAICRGIVAGHGGNILVKNMKPKGAQFTVELPMVICKN